MPARSLTFMTSSLKKLFWKIVLSVLVLSWGSAYAQDQYNAQNGQLTIPLVKAFGNLYRGVVVQVGKVLAVRGGAPQSLVDEYDAKTSQLTIPSVNAFGQNYTNVVVAVESVLKVDGVSYAPSLVSYGELDLTIPSGLAQNNLLSDNIYYDIIAVGDVNMDGNDDILLGIMRNEAVTNKSVPRVIKPVLLLFNPVSKNFIVSEEFSAVTSSHIWPRQGAIEDFDGDGRNDIFIGDTGVDGLRNNCGYQNSLILNKPTGMVNVSDRLPQGWDYSHGLITADFNADGKKDILVLNSAYLINQWNTVNAITCIGYTGQKIRNRSYVFDVTGSAELTLAFASNDIDASGNPPLNVTDAYSREQHVGTSVDLNGDGYPDLIFGGAGVITILESNGKQSYKTSQRLPPPAAITSKLNTSTCNKYWGACDTPYSYVTTADIDGDGQLEIIASVTYNNFGNWRGQFFQVLKRLNENWIDISDKVFPVQNGLSDNLTWCYRLQFVDLNLDGIQDIVCNNLDAQQSQIFWINNAGVFSPWATPPSQSGKRYTVLKMGGSYSVLGFTGVETVKIDGWKY